MQSSASSYRQGALRLSSDTPFVNQQPRRTVDRTRDGPGSFFHASFIWHVVAAPDGAALLCRVTPRHDATPLARDVTPLARAAVPVKLGRAVRQPASRGGLSGWQQKLVTEYIEANLAEALRLADMAGRVRLSPFHFARAFKQSFGMPPHRYHVARRIARAKDLLADPDNSVTGIARALGFAETSSFSSTFRRVTGASPSGFRRDGA